MSRFEQAFKNIDDVLRKEAGCTTELDYTEQTSWLLFLKYLEGLEQDKADEAKLGNMGNAGRNGGEYYIPRPLIRGIVQIGVEELDREKLRPLLLLKYHNAIADAVADLGRPEEIGNAFAGFFRSISTKMRRDLVPPDRLTPHCTRRPPPLP